MTWQENHSNGKETGMSFSAACHAQQFPSLQDHGRKRFLDFSMMSFQYFFLVQKMTSLTFQGRKMLLDLQKSTFWSKSHQQ